MKRVLLLVSLGLGFQVLGQQARLNEANALYNKMAYYYAAEAYEDVLQRSKDSSLVGVKLADCYDKIEDNEKAVIWYNYLSRNTELTQKQLLRSAVVRRQVGDYAGSLGQLTKYESKYGQNDVTKKMILEHDNLEHLQTDDGTFTVVKQDPVNTIASDMGAAYYKDNMIFVSSAIKSKYAADDTYNRQANKFYNIYTSTVDGSGNLSKTKKLKNTKYHDGPIIYDKANDLVYFTRNNYTDGKKATDVNKVMRLKIYQGKLVDKKITDEKELAINNDQYSTGHPTLSADGKTMFFASDRPGGFGGSDIYKVAVGPNGTIGEPINMGPSVNTTLNEFFPNVHSATNMLFFASEGHIGLGGLDNFVGQLNENQTAILGLRNLGAPMNSRFDDFGVIMNPESTYGYFVSNRSEGKGDDDIYGFKLNQPIPLPLLLEGVITDANTNEILPNTTVVLRDENNKELASTESNELGIYNFGLDATRFMDYKLTATRDSFTDGANQFTTKDLPANTRVINRDLTLARKPMPRNGDNLALHFVIKDKVTNQPMPGVQLRLYDNVAQKEMVNIVSDEKGDFYLPLNHKKIYDELSFNILADKAGYLPKRVYYKSVYEKSGLIELEDYMEKEEAVINTDVSSSFDINPIYFDLDRYNIRADAKVELDKIVKIMNDYPEMEIELGSHTDCRQTMAYNERLSDRRAKASAAYIKSRIKNPARIYGKGYGETQLKNDCGCEPTNESSCSDDQHQMNRRTEFKIIKVGAPKNGVKPNTNYIVDNSNGGSRVVTNVNKQNTNTSNTNTTASTLNTSQNNTSTSATTSNTNTANTNTSSTTTQTRTTQSSANYAGGDTYTIKEGETLYRVFVNTGVSVQELKRLNKLHSNTVRVGQVLVLK